jgi:hypothetical protein
MCPLGYGKSSGKNLIAMEGRMEMIFAHDAVLSRLPLGEWVRGDAADWARVTGFEIPVIELVFIELAEAGTIEVGQSIFEPGKPTFCRVN